jgi:hypothetical protein
VQREQVEANLQRALSLLDNARGQYLSAPGTVRRQMNQAVFARLWLVEDEIAGADLTPAYRRLLADDLAGEIATEEAREHSSRTRSTDLWTTPMEDHTVRPEPTNVTFLRARPAGTARGPLEVGNKEPRPFAGSRS